jgi:integrase
VLTPYELTELRLEDVMDKSGKFHSIWTLPGYVAQNGEARELGTSDHIIKIMQSYINWWIANDLHSSGKFAYQGRDPKASFILNDNFEGYTLSKREKGGPQTLPVTINKKLLSLLITAGYKGVTPSAYRDSGIKLMWDSGGHYNDIMDFTGIKSKSTLDAKIRPHEIEIGVVLNNVFRNIR